MAGLTWLVRYEDVRKFNQTIDDNEIVAYITL